MNLIVQGIEISSVKTGKFISLVEVFTVKGGPDVIAYENNRVVLVVSSVLELEQNVVFNNF